MTWRSSPGRHDENGDGAFEGGSSSLHFSGYTTEEERRPVRELYGVFRRPRNDDDLRAGEVAARWGALDFGLEDLQHPRPAGVSEAQWRRAQLGNVVESEGRLLLSGLGGEADVLYAAPTDNDCIALALLPNGGGGCSAPGPDGLELGWLRGERGELVVYGLVADAIEAVDVIVAGVARAARMGENAFGLRLERAHESTLERVVLHRRDGTTNEIGLRPED